MIKTELEKGKYYIGDPVYCFKSWNVKENHNNIVLYGDRVSSDDTTYLDNDDNAYQIKSGMIYIIPLEIALKDNVMTEKQLNHSGRVVEFYKDFKVIIKNGLFIFDNIEIDTNEEEYF